MNRGKTIWKWTKVGALGLLAAGLMVMLYGFGLLALGQIGFSTTIAHVERRELEKLEDFYGYLELTVISASLLWLAIVGLLNILNPEREPGRLIALFRRKGLRLAPAFGLLFVISVVFRQKAAKKVIALKYTAELFPVGVILQREWLTLCAWISLFAAIVSFGAGLKGNKQFEKEKNENYLL